MVDAAVWMFVIVLGIGLTMFGVSLWWMGTLTINSSFVDFIMPQALRGASVLFVMLPTNQIALGCLPATLPEERVKPL